MPRIMLDGQDHGARPAPATWADLLAAIERDLAVSGRLIAAVRLDGVELTAFREPESLGRPLAADTIVEVETSTPEALLDEGLREAARSVTALRDAALSLADGYRLVDVRDADAHLATFAETLANLMALIATAAQVRRLDLAALEVDGHRAAAVVTQLDSTIEALLEAHQGRDWVTLADVLRHDLAPLMPRVGLLIDALGAAAGGVTE